MIICWFSLSRRPSTCSSTCRSLSPMSRTWRTTTSMLHILACLVARWEDEAARELLDQARPHQGVLESPRKAVTLVGYRPRSWSRIRRTQTSRVDHVVLFESRRPGDG